MIVNRCVYLIAYADGYPIQTRSIVYERKGGEAYTHLKNLDKQNNKQTNKQLTKQNKSTFQNPKSFFFMLSPSPKRVRANFMIIHLFYVNLRNIFVARKSVRDAAPTPHPPPPPPFRRYVPSVSVIGN